MSSTVKKLLGEADDKKVYGGGMSDAVSHPSPTSASMPGLTQALRDDNNVADVTWSN